MTISNAKLRITSPPAAYPVTLDALKSFLRIDFSDDDDLLAMQIAAATNMCETRVWRSFVTRTYELSFDAFPCSGFGSAAPVWFALNGLPWGSGYGLSISRSAIEVPNPPCVSLSSITYVGQDGTTQTLDPSAYRVSAGDPGQIIPSYGSFFPIGQPTISGVKIVYQAGYGTTPEDCPPEARLAVMHLAAHLYNTRDSGSESEIPPGIGNLLAPLNWGGYR